MFSSVFAVAPSVTTVAYFCNLLLCLKPVQPICDHPCGPLLWLFSTFIACGPLIWLEQDLLLSTEQLPRPLSSQISVQFPASRSSIQVPNTTSAYRSAIPAPYPLLLSTSCIMWSYCGPVSKSHIPVLYCNIVIPYPYLVSTPALPPKSWSRIKLQRVDLLFEYRMPLQCNIPISVPLSRIPYPVSRIPYPAPLLQIVSGSGLLE